MIKKFKNLKVMSLRAAGQGGSLTAIRTHGSSSSLRASEGCVAISFATGLLRWLRHYQKPFANLLIIDAAQPPRNDAGGQASFLNGWMAHDYEISARSAHNSLVTSCSLLVTKAAFTMAEILLSLTIIGVVAAITLPSLTGNINERTWNTQRKALYSRMSQAVSLMPALNGYGKLREASGTEGDADYDAGEDTGAETFVTSGLSKVLKINNICGSDNLKDCGINSTLTTANGSKISFPKKMSELNPLLTRVTVFGGFSAPDSKAAAFETANGESVVVYYNPKCQMNRNERSKSYHDYYYFIYPKICVNFVYDLNGSKGPNTVGKDIGFMSVLYSSDSVVASPQLPIQMASSARVPFSEALGVCKTQDEQLRLPNIDELISIFANQNLLYGTNYTSSTGYWSSNKASSNLVWIMGMESAAVWCKDITKQNWSVHCVKRD